LTPRQAAKVDALKSASPDFTTMRRLAMRFRGILRSKDIQKFCVWLDDAQQSGIYAMQRFARTVRRDVDAVTNALTEGWSNGQTEGQINRLKTLKRAMYGRAGTELLRAGCCLFTCLCSTESEADPIKRIFSNIMAKSKRLILLHPISRAKMAADTGHSSGR
jgi:transposase